MTIAEKKRDKLLDTLSPIRAQIWRLQETIQKKRKRGKTTEDEDKQLKILENLYNNIDIAINKAPENKEMDWQEINTAIDEVNEEISRAISAAKSKLTVIKKYMDLRDDIWAIEDAANAFVSRTKKYTEKRQEMEKNSSTEELFEVFQNRISKFSNLFQQTYLDGNSPAKSKAFFTAEKAALDEFKKSPRGEHDYRKYQEKMNIALNELQDIDNPLIRKNLPNLLSSAFLKTNFAINKERNNFKEALEPLTKKISELDEIIEESDDDEDTEEYKNIIQNLHKGLIRAIDKIPQDNNIESHKMDLAIHAFDKEVAGLIKQANKSFKKFDDDDDAAELNEQISRIQKATKALVSKAKQYTREEKGVEKTAFPKEQFDAPPKVQFDAFQKRIGTFRALLHGAELTGDSYGASRKYLKAEKAALNEFNLSNKGDHDYRRYQEKMYHAFNELETIADSSIKEKLTSLIESPFMMHEFPEKIAKYEHQSKKQETDNSKSHLNIKSKSNPYELLGVGDKALAPEIRAQYIKKIQPYLPPRGKESPEEKTNREKNYNEITDAYKRLIDRSNKDQQAVAENKNPQSMNNRK